MRAYYDGAFPPPAVPMPAHETDPFPLTPDAWANADFRVQLQAHLKVPLERRFRNRKSPGSSAVALEAVEHDIVVSFLRGAAGRLGGGGRVGG